MNTEKKYKTQGTISSVSIETEGKTSFTIDPVEPYDFPAKENGETKKCVLLQPVSGEAKNGKYEADKSATEREEFLKVPPSTRFSISGKEETSVATFGDLILLKENRNKIELEVSEAKAKTSLPNTDKSDNGNTPKYESTESSLDTTSSSKRPDSLVSSEHNDSTSNQPKSSFSERDNLSNHTKNDDSYKSDDSLFVVSKLTVK